MITGLNLTAFQFLVADDVAKLLPPFAIELHKLHLVEAPIVCRAGIYFDTRQ